MTDPLAAVGQRMDAKAFYERAHELPHTELIDGRVCEMNSPGMKHGVVEAQFTRYLVEWTEARGRGVVATGEVGYQLSDDHVRAADVAVHAEPLELPDGWSEVMPDVVIEVLSPNDRPGYVRRKVKDWLDAGVREVWLADPVTKVVDIHAKSGANRAFTHEQTLESEALPGLRIELARVFRST